MAPEDALANAPQKENNLIRIRRVLDDESTYQA